jgi:muramoyltetrapeptide carboxypeptidase
VSPEAAVSGAIPAAAVSPARLLGAALPPGGVIGVPAPASPWENRSEVLRGVEWWESRGYRVKLTDGVWRRDAYVAGDAKARALDLESLFADPDVDLVQCLTGGYGSAQLIPNLDFEVIAANPKPFIGYSDVTALHVALRQATGLVTFYGPHLWTVGAKETSEFTRQRLLGVLGGDGTGLVPRDPEDPYVRALRGGKVTAPLVGGCLWLLMQTMGTPWEVRLDGCILFFEDVDAPPWYIDGMLTQLTHAGKLDRVAGVVVGEMDKCDWHEGRPEWPRTKSLEDVLEERLEPLGVPAIYKLPLGHGKHLATIPLGVHATLDADARTLEIVEAALGPAGAGGTAMEGS